MPKYSTEALRTIALVGHAGAGFVEQRFREARFAGARVAYEGNGPECFSAVLGHGVSSEILLAGPG